MIIANEQIRGARAMLNWSQRQLASAAGISLRGLRSIEAGLVVPRLETLKAIKKALEKANIEFMDEGAVRLRHEILDVEKYEGDGALEVLIHDFMEAYRQDVDELLLCNSDEKRWVELTTVETAEAYYKTLIEYDVKERCLIVHGDKATFGYPTLYRWIPKKHFSEVCYGVYGTTLALIVWQPTIRITLIRNAAIADSYRRHFEFLWECAETPPFVEPAQQQFNPDRPHLLLCNGIPQSRYPDKKQKTGIKQSDDVKQTRVA